ncbi:extracellular solute-binding protein [Paenibacillus qinlingensis]|uniref:Aldouronate transport system substrate-binding protein n=1 Tax=Paenibacillus qinlingensis TaxID=1837343 RepID=A0ABU1NSW3_9BACL|nr:extracellular solute-binding protein [Paenibacillus qinlingensis]MDR6550572.1 putative aldouronate transport system substrate-binding protein [Paenibacillus qinlingensis]
MQIRVRKWSTKSMLVALSAGLVLAGCSKQEEKPTQESKGTTAASQTPAQGPKLNKSAKIRIAVPDNAGVKGYEQGASANDNQFLNAIKEKTGYTNIEWNVIPTANQLETYNLMFASGDVYDLIYTSDLNIYKRFSAQGALLPLEEPIKQFGSEIGKLVTDNAWTAVTLEGKKYAIPVPPYQKFENVDLGSGFLARQDWMDKLGLTAPKNLDELYTFLKTIKDKDPSGKGTIPYVAAAGNNGNPLDGLDIITSAFGLSGISNLAVPFIVKDGKLVDAQDVYFKEMLTYLNKLFKEGLIDNEYLFNKTQQVSEKMSSGKAAAAFAGYWDPASYLAGLTKTDANAKLSFLPTVEGKDGVKGYPMPAPVSNFYIIPKNAKNANEAVDLLNSYLKDKDLQKYVNFGKEGVHYDMVDNKLTPKKPAYDQIIYKLYYRMWNTPEIWLPNALLGGYEQAMKSFAQAGPQLTAFNINQYRPQTDAELAKGRALIDLRNEYVAKIINGALPITALDDYFKKADAAGRQDVIKASQDWFTKEGKGIYDKLSKK